MSTEPRRQSATLLLTAAQPQYGSAPEHSTRSFVGPSAVTTTTFTHPNVDATLNGCWVIPEDGTLKNQPRRVKSVSGTTATVDAPWSTVTGVTAIRAWQPSDVVVRVTTAHASNIISSPHAAIAAEPDDYWVDYWLIGLSGANFGMAKKVTAFVAVSGTFTGGANAATALGDTFILRRQVRPAQPVDAKVTPKTAPRTIVGTGDSGGDMPMILANDGAISVVIEQRPLISAGGSGTLAPAPIELGDLLRDHFTQTRDTGGTVTAADANSITTTSGVFSVNGFVGLANGKVAQVLSTSGAGAVISKYGTGQAGFANVPTSSIAYASCHYQRKSSGYIHRVWDVWEGAKMLNALYDSMPTLSLKIDRQSAVKFTFGYTSAGALRYNIDRPVALGAAFPLGIPDVGVPTAGMGARMVIDGVTVSVISLEMNVGLKPVGIQSLGGMMQMDGYMMDLEAPTGTLTIAAHNDDLPSFKALTDRMLSGVPFHMLYHKGTAGGRMWCLSSPTACFTGADFSYSEGQGVFAMPFTCVSPLVAVDHADALLYPTATYPGLKELSIGHL